MVQTHCTEPTHQINRCSLTNDADGASLRWQFTSTTCIALHLVVSCPLMLLLPLLSTVLCLLLLVRQCLGCFLLSCCLLNCCLLGLQHASCSCLQHASCKLSLGLQHASCSCLQLPVAAVVGGSEL